MEFVLEVSLKIEGTGISSGGSFSARSKSEIPRTAYEYIQKMKQATGYRTTTIEKVMVNGSEDITEKVMEIENQPFPSQQPPF